MHSQIYVLHENRAWVEPLWSAFSELDLPYEEWFLSEGMVFPLTERRRMGSFITV